MIEILFKEHITALRGVVDSARRERAQVKKDYYEGKFIDYKGEILGNHFKNADRIAPSFEYLNILEYFINKRARILKRGVDIRLEKSDEIFSKWATDYSIIAKLKQFERYVELLGMVAIRFFKDNGEVNFEMITPNRFYVATDPDDSLKPVLFIWQRQNYTEIVPQEIQYYAYDSENFYILNESGQVLSSEPHGYGVIPVVFMYSKYRSDEFYVESDEDLRIAQDNIAVWLTSINYLAKYQAFSQPVAKGLPENISIATDPSTIIRIPMIPEMNTFGDFEFRTPDSKIGELWNTLISKIRALGGRYEVNVNELIKDVQQKSGIAYEWENLQVMESREDREELWRDNIKRFVRMYLRLKSQLNPAIDPAQAITIDFPDIKLIDDPEKEMNRWLVLISRNVRNVLDWIISDNPDIKTYDEALRIYNENKKFNETIAAEIPSDDDEG